MLAIMVLGLFSYLRLPVEQMPDISIPVAVIGTPYPGASAKAVEQDVTRPIEEAINTVSGIKVLRSTSREGWSWVVAEFELSVDIKTAVQDVRDKVAQARRNFNKDVGEPTVTRADNDNDQPLIYLSIGSDSRSLRELSDLAPAPGGQAPAGRAGCRQHRGQRRGGAGNVHLLNPGKAGRLRHWRGHGGGRHPDGKPGCPGRRSGLPTSEKLVRVMAKLKTVENFESIIVGRTGTGANTAPVKLGQVATIQDAQREETSIATENGKRVISLQVRKTHGANTIEMAEAIRKQITEIKKGLPPDIRLNITEDDSEFIKDGVDNVKHTIWKARC